MNKVELVYELTRVKNGLNNITPVNGEQSELVRTINNTVDSVIIDLLDEDACEDCPAMKKVDDLIEATKLREWLMETAPKAASMTADEILEAEKMARGGTD